MTPASPRYFVRKFAIYKERFSFPDAEMSHSHFNIPHGENATVELEFTITS